MHGIQDIIEEAATLPIEERVFLVDSLLRSLNTPEPNVDTAWVDIAQKRLGELRSGKIKPIPGDEIFSNIRERFSR